jgi:hypothetical protein
MAYKDFYTRVPGTNITYNDGSLAAAKALENGPRVMIAASAAKGITGRLFTAESLESAISEFGEFSELATAYQSALANLPQNSTVDLVRIATKSEHLLIQKKVKDGSSEYETIIKISPKRQGDVLVGSSFTDAFKAYRLALVPVKKGNIYKQRVIVIQDLTTSTRTIVYDSELEYTQNLADFDIEINNDVGNDQILYTPLAYDKAGAALSLADASAKTSILINEVPTFDALVIGNIHSFNSNPSAASSSVNTSLYQLTKHTTESNYSPDYLNKYSSLEVKYQDLDYLTSDMIYVEGCYADILPFDLVNATISEAIDYGSYNLGYMWKYVHEGTPYIFMFGRKDALNSSNVSTDERVLATTTVGGTVTTQLSYQVGSAGVQLGDLLNLFEVEILNLAAASDSVEMFPLESGKIKVAVKTASIDAGETKEIKIGKSDAIIFTIKIKSTYALPANKTAKFTIRASKVAGTLALSDYLIAKNDTNLDYDKVINCDPFVISAFKLTGQLVPEAVLEQLLTFTSWIAPTNTSVSLILKEEQIREVSFLHQAASMAYKASNIYRQCVSFVPVSQPKPSNDGVQKWAGKAPLYQINDENGELVVGQNGTMLQGCKLLFGATDYRGGKPFGGIILTTGSNLPNGEPYGIDDTDEAVDSKGLPIDIGKHVIVIGSWGSIVSQNTRTDKILALPKISKFVNLAPAVMGKLLSLPINEEPIGPVNGRVSGVSVLGVSVPKSLLNSMALGRICMFDGSGALSILRTAALPSSDYTRVSTLRAANRILSNIRDMALPFLGKTVDFARTTMAQRIEGFMTGEVRLGNIQGYQPTKISATKADEIAGRLNVSVSFIPPFSLETVNVDMTVLPPQ